LIALKQQTESQMRKDKSEKKVTTVQVMEDTARALNAAANVASRIDLAVVAMVAQGATAARAVLAAETEANKAAVARISRRLLAFARLHNATPGPMVRAASNMGEAFREYGLNEYGNANIKSMNARDNIR
jgi:hypothetical protein